MKNCVKEVTNLKAHTKWRFYNNRVPNVKSKKYMYVYDIRKLSVLQKMLSIKNKISALSYGIHVYSKIYGIKQYTVHVD